MAEEKQASTEQQCRQAAWARLDALLEEVHSRPTDLTPEEIEAEITAARQEAKWRERFDRLLAEVHSHPTDLAPEEIEAEITLAMNEVKEMRRGGR